MISISSLLNQATIVIAQCDQTSSRPFQTTPQSNQPSPTHHKSKKRGEREREPFSIIHKRKKTKEQQPLHKKTQLSATEAGAAARHHQPRARLRLQKKPEPTVDDHRQRTRRPPSFLLFSIQKRREKRKGHLLIFSISLAFDTKDEKEEVSGLVLVQVNWT